VAIKNIIIKFTIFSVICLLKAIFVFAEGNICTSGYWEC